MLLHELAQAASEVPLSERLLVAVVGPLISTTIGTGVIGWVLWRLSNHAQARRMGIELRRELLAAVTKTAGSLYLATQSYWRALDDPELSDEDKRVCRNALHVQYRESRTAAGWIEPELRALFGDRLADEWHKVDDLLTVRYMQLVGRATTRLYELNAKGYGHMEHSGLTAAELADCTKVLRAYRQALSLVTSGLLQNGFLKHFTQGGAS